jgi:pyruvyltransferase
MSALGNDLLGVLKRAGKSLLQPRCTPLYWSKCANWGDALNPFLVERIANRKVRHETNPFCWKYFVIGSILERVDRYSIVWGTGLIGPDHIPQHKPFAIHAVRGPLTREYLLKHGIECPAIYGDPALLLPHYLRPQTAKKFKVGVIPHYTDRDHPWIQALNNNPEVLVIDVYSDVTIFVQNVLSCDSILSSSLHGLICADAYGVPNQRIILFENPRIGGNFKFDDYYRGVNIIPNPALHPNMHDSPIDISLTCSTHGIDIDLQKLIECCPFR